MALHPETPAQQEALVGLGSNLGESAQILSDAAQALADTPGVHVKSVSSLYYTTPVGGVAQPDYCNQAALLVTSLGPEELLGLLLAIEADFGRTRSVRWGPRTLDLDLLLFGQEVIQTSSLTVPHPRLHERGFVLAPLVELSPEWTHPTKGCTIRQLYLEWVTQVGRPQEHIRRVASICPLERAETT